MTNYTVLFSFILYLLVKMFIYVADIQIKKLCRQSINNFAIDILSERSSNTSH